MKNIYSLDFKDLKKIIGKRLVLLALLLFAVFSKAQAFGCNSNKLYLSQANILYDVGISTNPFTYTTVGTASGNYNAIGINPVNGVMYGMATGSASNTVLRINSNGTSSVHGSITGLPLAIYNAGEIDNVGNFYVKQNTSNNQIFKINLTTLTFTTITLSANTNLPDLAYNPVTGLLYGVELTNGQLISINPNTGLVTQIGGSYFDGPYGAMFGSNSGEMFGVSNAGGFYQFNLSTGGRVLLSDAPASSANDGAHCVTSPITLNTDLTVTKTDGSTTYTPGTTTTYTIVARNNGPFGVLNARVIDNVPSGIPASNMSYTAVASSGSTTSVSGTQTGAINDLVGLPNGGTVTYTVVINVPLSYTGNLVNTVTISAPSNVTDSNTGNNSATDTDTQLNLIADLAVTKTDGVSSYASGTTTTYTVVARNNGPSAVLNAVVSDPVPAGIPSANVSYTAVAAGGATTSVSGTQSGAINDVVSLPNGSTVTYTVAVNIPFSYTGNLVNTATITPPSNVTDDNNTNNTATDTDTQAVCYRPAVTAGTRLTSPSGITSLGRAGASSGGANWPLVRNGAWTVLEAKTKGFVPNRLTSAQIAAIPTANLVEGMMVYNITLDCLQVNINGTAAGWTCFNTQTCPTN